MFDRVLDAEWLVPKKEGLGDGYEYLRACAAIGARISTAVERFECGLLLMYARGGAYATGEVQFYRPNDIMGAVTVKGGSRVTTSRGGRSFITTDDAVFGSSDLVATAPVRAVAQGWEWNTTGVRMTLGGETLPGDIDTCVTLYLDPPYGDPSIRVEQIADTTGGAAPMLDLDGRDLGFPRYQGEDDAAYSVRLRTLVDTVSPAALRRAINRVFGRYGHTGVLVEVHELNNFLDAPNVVFGPPVPFDAQELFYDDTRTIVPPIRNRVTEWRQDRAAFIVVWPLLGSITDRAWYFDDTADLPIERVAPDTQGLRAVQATDVPDNFDEAFGLIGFYDGFDAGHDALYAALHGTLNATRAAGVAVYYEFEEK
jgi:hypothetical protein